MNNDFKFTSSELKRSMMSIKPIDTLMFIQEFMDSINIFAYENWINGKITDGPNIKKYWVDITVMYKHNHMPDPRAGSRLTKRGCKVKFYKDSVEVPKTIKTDDYDSSASASEKRKRKKKIDAWVVEIKIPRHIIDRFEKKYQEMLNECQS